MKARGAWAHEAEGMTARGRATYRSFCASCSEVVMPPPADLTRLQELVACLETLQVEE